MKSPLSGKICLVTGGAQGVGWAICQALADRGAIVYACDISEENIASANRELATLRWRDAIRLTRCDVGDRADFERWIAGAVSEMKRVDILINNAAFVRWEDVMAMSVEDAERSMLVGYNSMVYSTKAVLPIMGAAGGGHIVNIGSIAGRIYAGGTSASYAAAKAAIDAYSQVLQTELVGSPITVTLIRPIHIAGTEFFRKHVPSSRMPRMADFIPYLTPPDVAKAVVQAIEQRRAIVNLPGYIGLLMALFDLAPNLFRAMVRGHAEADYGDVRWKYRPDDG